MCMPSKINQRNTPSYHYQTTNRGVQTNQTCDDYMTSCEVFVCLFVKIFAERFELSGRCLLCCLYTVSIIQMARNPPINDQLNILAEWARLHKICIAIIIAPILCPEVANNGLSAVTSIRGYFIIYYKSDTQLDKSQTIQSRLYISKESCQPKLPLKSPKKAAKIPILTRKKGAEGERKVILCTSTRSWSKFIRIPVSPAKPWVSWTRS